MSQNGHGPHHGQLIYNQFRYRGKDADHTNINPNGVVDSVDWSEGEVWVVYLDGEIVRHELSVFIGKSYATQHTYDPSWVINDEGE